MLNKLKFSESSNNVVDRNKEYYDIVEAIKRRFEKRYSPVYDLCEKILMGIQTSQGNYHLLLGLVQSGKSLPISWLVWCLNFRKEFHKPTILLTINLDTVRRDFMGKIGRSGIVQQIVYEVCGEMMTDLTNEEIAYFFCPRPFDLPKLKGKKVLELGEVPILIMHPQNHKGVIRSFLRFVTGPTQKVPVFIMDEVHSLYSGTKEFIENNGILLKDKDTNRAMISWLLDKVKEHKTSMIGITATPYRTMADTHVYPDKGCVYKLPLVAPFPNMKYYGEGGDGKVNIFLRPHYVTVSEVASEIASEISSEISSEVASEVASEISSEVASEISSEISSEVDNVEDHEDILSKNLKKGRKMTKKARKALKKDGDFNYRIIEEILDRPAFKVPVTRTSTSAPVVVDASFRLRVSEVREVTKVEVPLVLITLERYNMQQEELRDAIKERFGDRVYCQVINQQGDPKLDEYFYECLESDVVCKEGACIIIGNNSLKAGISVKPAPGTSCSKTIDGQEYFISGITDQISDFSKINGESDMQLLRILGWYPEVHQCNLWLSDEEAKKNYYELYHIYEQFEQAYDGHPSTVGEISTTADQICGGYCHYSRNTRSNSKVHKQFCKLEDAMELTTQVIFLGDLPDLDLEKWISTDKVEKISDLFKKATLRNRFRTELFSALKQSDIVFDTTRFQIPTNKQRLNEIIDSAFLPGDKDQWKVNSFLYGPDAEESSLIDSYIIWFDHPYDQRPTLSNDFPSLCFWLSSSQLTSTVASLSSLNSLNLDNLGNSRDSWVSATFKPIMTHKNLNIVDRKLTDTHESTIEKMTELAELASSSEKETNLNAWHFCMKACKKVVGNGSTAIAKTYYNKSDAAKQEMQQIGKSRLDEHEKLEKIVKIIDDLHSKTTEKLPVFLSQAAKKLPVFLSQTGTDKKLPITSPNLTLITPKVQRARANARAKVHLPPPTRVPIKIIFKGPSTN
jgi:hypothetical protein